jgi:hypothetical protein
MEAWIMYIAPIAPPALENTHSEGLWWDRWSGKEVFGVREFWGGLILREMTVDGYVDVRFVRMCAIMPSVEFGEAATADCASWWIAMGSKTYHRD